MELGQIASEQSKQQACDRPVLHRQMKLFGTLLITISSITPASSVFIIMPGMFSAAGSGAFLAMLVAAAVSGCIALVYAELSSAFPLTGGEYAIVGRVAGPLAGFLTLGVVLLSNLLVMAVMAIGMSNYLVAAVPSLPLVPITLVGLAVATLISMLNIRSNALITGLFLCVELGTIMVLIWLGFREADRPAVVLLTHPLAVSTQGLIPVSASQIWMAATIAIFAFNGFGTAVYLGEETKDAPRQIARAVLWAFGIAVATEVAPLFAVLIGVPDLWSFFHAQDMLGSFITLRGGHLLSVIVNVGVALAIFNALIAQMVQNARLAYSTGRDAIWSPVVNRTLLLIDRRFDSPWAATAVCGCLTALACGISEPVLLLATGSSIVVIYLALAVTVICGRRNGTTAHAAYRMPGFPVAPLIGGAAMLYMMVAGLADPDVGRKSLLITMAVMAAFGIYYKVVVSRRPDWRLRAPDDIG